MKENENLPLPLKVAIMANNVEHLTNDVGEIKDLIREHTSNETQIWEKVTKYMSEQMDRKANVWVEKALKSVLYIIVGTIVAALLGLVIVKTGVQVPTP